MDSLLEFFLLSGIFGDIRFPPGKQLILSDQLWLWGMDLGELAVSVQDAVMEGHHLYPGE